MQRNIRKLVLFAGLPLAAIGLVVFLLSWGAGSGHKVQATPLAGLDFSLTAAGGVGGCDSNGTDPTPTGPGAACKFSGGSGFTVALNKNSAAPFQGYDALVTWSGSINYLVGSMVQQGVGVWLDPGPLATQNANGCGVPVGDSGATGTAKATGPGLSEGNVATSCTQGTSSTADSTYSGALLTMGFECKAVGTGTITLVHGPATTDIFPPANSTERDTGSEQLNITCSAATQTPTQTRVPPTATPPAVPFVNKVPALQNVFLTRNGAKIPPTTCEAGTNAATLTETLKGPITTTAKGELQHLGAFEFEMRFDEKLVCVSVTAGSLFTGPTAGCYTVRAKGVVRFGCVTSKKNAGINGPGALAVITVKPQPELFSQLRPNQENGIAVQILNQGCQLSDEQGFPIPISSCEDADITFRFLEGDVTGPNCTVNVIDAQDIAMRWGSIKGNLLFSFFSDLSPSGHGVNGDGRIDIHDLQFVFGRINSTCANPWPAQLPVNPKA